MHVISGVPGAHMPTGASVRVGRVDRQRVLFDHAVGGWMM